MVADWRQIKVNLYVSPSAKLSGWNGLTLWGEWACFAPPNNTMLGIKAVMKPNMWAMLAHIQQNLTIARFCHIHFSGEVTLNFDCEPPWMVSFVRDGLVMCLNPGEIGNKVGQSYHFSHAIALLLAHVDHGLRWQKLINVRGFTMVKRWLTSIVSGPQVMTVR